MHVRCHRRELCYPRHAAQFSKSSQMSQLRRPRHTANPWVSPVGLVTLLLDRRRSRERRLSGDKLASSVRRSATLPRSLRDLTSRRKSVAFVVEGLGLQATGSLGPKRSSIKRQLRLSLLLAGGFTPSGELRGEYSQCKADLKALISIGSSPFQAICTPMHNRINAITLKMPCTVDGEILRASCGAYA